MRHIGHPLDRDWSMKTPLRLIAALVMTLAPRSASAEVSDKISSVPEQWMFAGVFAALAFVAVRWRWWLAAPLALLLACMISGEWEFTGGFIGAAILEEQGWGYFVSLWCSWLFMASVLVFGTFVGWQNRPGAGTSIGQSPRPS